MTPLETAILETLAYSDIFDYPLTLAEIRRYLALPVSMQKLEQCVQQMEQVASKDSYFFVVGREEIVSVRKEREAASRKAFNQAVTYGRLLGKLPFVRMVALTGSLAMLNLSKNPDMDYMLVTARGRVWTARAFAILFGKITQLFGHTICPNLIVSEQALEWPLHDLYSAREFCQMIPISGLDMYIRLRKANTWVESFFPNESTSFENLKLAKAASLLDFPLRGVIGQFFEDWEMKRKIAKFSQQAGCGEETIFTAEVCQGNFHHHRSWTRIAFSEKLKAIGLELSPKYLEGRLSE